MPSIVMSPAPGARLVGHVGDTLNFSIRAEDGIHPDQGWRARLRTTLGRGRAWRAEIVRAHTARVPPFGVAWHDVPMTWNGAGWSRDLLLTEVGYSLAKPYLVDGRGYLHWPEGPDAGIGVHPDRCRSANLVYCAFTRLFGETRAARHWLPDAGEGAIRELEERGFAVLPPSGTFRDLARQLPFVVGRLGCRILHLLPVHPTPTVHARMGRMGSPYAALDLTAVDPALVEFDRRSNGVDQFRELTREAHRLGARVFLDLVINHTGWGSRLFEEHPEYFRREADGTYVSPGAWGVVWEDLVELEQRDVALWDLMAEALLTWCRRGVDGFRCDAGYQIPVHVWQYITARVRAAFPDTVFLLEGLGGSWEATERLLTEGGLQWAYSELFQNYSGAEVQRYLDYALEQSARVGTYVHYSETHDNDRLAVRGRAWSLLRNRLCALASVNGGFGFTCGVEWLAPEKIRVHQRTGLAWDQPENLVGELSALNRLLADHPAFFAGATVRRISPPGSPVLALYRCSADGQWPLLVLVNTQVDQAAAVTFPATELPDGAAWSHDLLGQAPPILATSEKGIVAGLEAGAAYCLAPGPGPEPGYGDRWRDVNARAAWAIRQAAGLLPAERLAPHPDGSVLAGQIEVGPAAWLAALSTAVARVRADREVLLDWTAVGRVRESGEAFPNTMIWRVEDARRVTLVPPGWWLVIQDESGFRAWLETEGADTAEHVESVPVAGGYVATLAPREPAGSVTGRLTIERHDGEPAQIVAEVRFLADRPAQVAPVDSEGLALLTNGRGGMARLRVDWGAIRSKYDCALGANLHASVPVDRHVFVKRVRAWLNADGFLSALDRHNLTGFTGGPVACWTFRANAGDGRHVALTIEAAMIEGRNTTVLRFRRDPGDRPMEVRLTLRVDLEDRSFHGETRRNPGAEHHFREHCRPLNGAAGFEFRPAEDRHLRVTVSRGVFHGEPEWCEGVPHPFEAGRGQQGSGDAYSPGWFEIPLAPGDNMVLLLDAESDGPDLDAVARVFRGDFGAVGDSAGRELEVGDGEDGWQSALRRACAAFVVRRGTGRTVVAGYPWFLDWGRDTLIAARGLLVGGWRAEVIEILETFGRFEVRGTLPNAIHGDNASNRDTSDAPLWYAVVVEEASVEGRGEVLRRQVAPGGPTIVEVVRRLVEGYLTGTPNGIRVDPESALVWSPSHFTWMDTNHPACTPREGYPVEIQALWIRALRFLRDADPDRAGRWGELAERAEAHWHRYFWIEEQGWYSDVLLAPKGTPARDATPDTALRCNMLLPVAFGLVRGVSARRAVMAALRHLLVPGAVRSLAPLPVSPPLPLRGPDGRLLNDPERPYRGRYEGDEDTSRKPAYHNGTAWTWFLPILAEALVEAWDRRPEAVRAARAILGSSDRLLHEGCAGHLPEIVDGDAPHTHRGCDAQAWSVTEALRVWRIVRERESGTGTG
ncbi:MAG: glycogen debranching enzyme N-terminal domain-containing protein [Verrucomicrobiae bacterium]|nr:glycogen debranching enzyme N-terminal domain-containing protein [Verrucomicrobiae bacterium]